MTCDRFDGLEPRYLRGEMSAVDAALFESHAAECATCGPRLETSTRRDVSSFSPLLPPALRAATLDAVRKRRVSRSRLPAWPWGGFAAAAAAMLAIVLFNSPDVRENASLPPTRVAGGDTVLATNAVTLATRKSREEFDAIDAAAREVQSALSASPSDPELRQFLSAILARRAELERRVKDASS